MRYAALRDVSEPEIIDALRTAGASVQPLDASGVPDLLVGYKGRNFLVEVKNPPGVGGPRGRKLSDRQRRWHAKWEGQVAVVRTVEEALELLGVLG